MRRNFNWLTTINKAVTIMSRKQSPVKRFWQSVGFKLFTTFFISIVLFVSIVGTLSYSISKNIIKDQVSVADHQSIILASENIDQIYEKYNQLAWQIQLNSSINEQVSALLNSELDDFAKLKLTNQLTTPINKYMFSNDNLANIVLFSLDGKQLIRGESLEMSNTGDIQSSDWFQKTLKAAGDVVWTPNAENKSSFYISRVTKKDSNSNIDLYVLRLEVKKEELQKKLASLNIGKTNVNRIITSENIIVASSLPKEIGTRFPLAIPKDQLSGYLYTDNSDRGDMIIYNTSGSLNKWKVVGSVEVQELVSRAHKIFNITLLMALLAAIVAIIIGWFIVHSIARPLVKLRNFMNEGEQGNLNIRTLVKSKDEIGQLGESFNKMMEKFTELVRQINSSAEEVLDTSNILSDISMKTTISAKEISIATDEIAVGAATLASKAEWGNDLAIAMASKLSLVVDSNAEMGKSAYEVQQVSEQGGDYMKQLVTKTSDIEKMIRNMVEKVDKLKNSTNLIHNVLDVLNNMTKQTNILSLNAKIEAARAGTAGKGFMVVADEIRTLADQSKKSIGIVGQITLKIQAEMEETVHALSEAYPLFQQQITSVKEAELIFGKVETRMGVFIRSLDEVTQSIHELGQTQGFLTETMNSVNAVSQQFSTTLEEVASLTSDQLDISEGLVRRSDNLQVLASTLKESIGKFKV